MKKALVAGGSSGVGLAITQTLIKKGIESVYIVDKQEPDLSNVDDVGTFKEKTNYVKFNVINGDYSLFDAIDDIDVLVITTGFGRVATFDNLDDVEIEGLVKCNLLAAIKIVKKYYGKISSKNDFYCAVMGSIAGHIASPLFSVYGATKSGLCSFVESINCELEYLQTQNRVLDVSPGALKGTNFNGEGNDISQVMLVAEKIVSQMLERNTLYIPEYENVYKSVIERYHDNPMGFGVESCDYKIKGGRLTEKPKTVYGYLSGTFDLFHIGHLNLLRRAKELCDHLTVGVHKSGAWKGKETFIPFEERIDIVRNIKYVDKAIESFTEDLDAYKELHFDKLFVGSDYKGTERFRRYEEYFADKGVEIIYFPYTQGTSSTQLRDAISKGKSDK